MTETYKVAARSVLTTHRLLDSYLIPFLEKTTKKRKLDISMVQYYALAYIKDHQGCSLSSVSKSLGFSLSAASKLVDILVEKNYLLRELDKNDRRKLVLNMSETIVNLFERYQQEIYENISDLLSALTEEDIAKLNEIANKLTIVSRKENPA